MPFRNSHGPVRYRGFGGHPVLRLLLASGHFGTGCATIVHEYAYEWRAVRGEYPFAPAHMRALYYIPRHRRVVCSSVRFPRRIYIVDATTLQQHHIDHPLVVASPEYIPETNELAIAYYHDVYLYDIDTGHHVRTLSGLEHGEEYVYDMVATQGYVIGALMGGYLAVWDISSATLVYTLGYKHGTIRRRSAPTIEVTDVTWIRVTDGFVVALWDTLDLSRPPTTFPIHTFQGYTLKHGQMATKSPNGISIWTLSTSPPRATKRVYRYPPRIGGVAPVCSLLELFNGYLLMACTDKQLRTLDRETLTWDSAPSDIVSMIYTTDLQVITTTSSGIYTMY